jgi:glutathione synthase/RimK-type ligase-like ATP-grasp enzyme
MILVCGIPSESPVELVLAAAVRQNVDVGLFNQRRCATASIDVDIDSHGVTHGRLALAPDTVDLDDVTGVYLRTMDHRYLPELRALPALHRDRIHADDLHADLVAWTEITSALVFNRCSAMASNGSKPYQAQLIQAAGFRVPRTLVTNDPAAVRAFRDELRGEVIFKSASGARSIVRRFEEDDLSRLNAIRWCPTQFQELIVGFDVRVHVVDRAVFAVRATSDAVDYRYAHSEAGTAAHLEPYELDPVWADACVRLAHQLGLPLAGIDLKITPEREVVCFEVNPSPGFSFYEHHTGQPISDAIVRSLAAA